VSEGLALLPVSPAIFFVLFASVAIGALVQGTIGFGMNVIAAPIAAALAPELLPAAMIILALPMTAGSAVRERAHIDRAGVVWTTLGRIPGIALGTFIVGVFDPDTLARWVGAMVVIAALMSLGAAPLTIRTGPAILAGAVGGVMGTTASMGGPPVALLYQHAPGPVMRATLGGTLLIGSLLSLLALSVAGHVSPGHWLVGLALTPAVAVGLFASRSLHGRMDAGWLRPSVVGFACVAGLAVIARGWV
jgi:uncharacterized protein